MALRLPLRSPIDISTILLHFEKWSIPQPWLFTFLRGSNAEQVAREIISGLSNTDVGPFGRITYYPMLTDAFRAPLVRLPDEGVVFPLNLVRISAETDAASVARMLAANRALYDRIRKAGGVLYPVNAFSDVVRRLAEAFRAEVAAAARCQAALRSAQSARARLQFVPRPGVNVSLLLCAPTVPRRVSAVLQCRGSSRSSRRENRSAAGRARCRRAPARSACSAERAMAHSEAGSL